MDEEKDVGIVVAVEYLKKALREVKKLKHYLHKTRNDALSYTSKFAAMYGDLLRDIDYLTALYEQSRTDGHATLTTHEVLNVLRSVVNAGMSTSETSKAISRTGDMMLSLIRLVDTTNGYIKMALKSLGIEEEDEEEEE